MAKFGYLANCLVISDLICEFNGAILELKISICTTSNFLLGYSFQLQILSAFQFFFDSGKRSYIITHLAVYVNYKPGITNFWRGLYAPQNHISPLSRGVFLQLEFLSKKRFFGVGVFCYEVPKKFAYMFRSIGL